MEYENTTIWMSKNTKKRLDSIGNFKESYDDVLNRIIDLIEEYLPEFKNKEVSVNASESD